MNMGSAMVGREEMNTVEKIYRLLTKVHLSVTVLDARMYKLLGLLELSWIWLEVQKAGWL